MDWSSYLPAVIALLGIPLAAASAWIREERLAQQTHRRWISQRWWERKADTYSRIVEALSRSLRSAIEYEEEYDRVRAGDMPLKRKEDEELERQRRLDLERLRQLAEAGAFVVTSEAALFLQDYFRKIDTIPDWAEDEEIIATHLEAARTCLNGIRACALADLGIQP